MTESPALSIDQRLAEAGALVRAGQDAAALAVLESVAETDQARTWIPRAEVLKRLGRLDEALALRRRVVEARPDSTVAEHNLAALLGDMDRAQEAEAAVRRAFLNGGDAPETWLVLGRALQAQEKHDAARDAYVQALVRRPAYVDAVRELGQLIWMQTADRDAALAPVKAALAAAPDAAELWTLRATLAAFAGDPAPQVWRTLTDGAPQKVLIEIAAAQAALDFDLDLALTHAEAAVRLAPSDRAALLKLAEVCVVRGDKDRALALLEPLQGAAPEDQFVLALMGGVRRHEGGLFDYAGFVRGQTIDTPEGWSDLDSYLADLAMSLRRLHTLRTHPVGQSLRHGTQTHVDLRASDDPVIKAFFTAIDGPIRRYMAGLGEGTDPLRRRNTGEYRIVGCWSVQLASNGFHTPHIHSQGWLSSACYVDLPAVVEQGDREGWIGFGGLPFGDEAARAPVHFEKPTPGKLVLFPSYMWHGTVPFSGDQTRLTIAFDVAPA